MTQQYIRSLLYGKPEDLDISRQYLCEIKKIKTYKQHHIKIFVFNGLKEFKFIIWTL